MHVSDDSDVLEMLFLVANGLKKIQNQITLY